MSAYITLGKAGDVVSLCPILHADYCETNQKPKLIVAQEYAQIPQALDYVETVVYPGNWRDLDGAIKFAKQNFGVFYTPQMHGENFQPKRQHPSFQLDQWARCGRLDQWGKLPLVLPRRPNSPCSTLWTFGLDDDSKFIAFADKSESSPFEHVEDLAESLAVTFPNHQIIRLSTLKAESLLDFLPLMDAADLIVSVDTVHLHLAQATTTPLIALVADRPSRWQGAAYHPKMSLHVRYGDYPLRKAELLHVAQCRVNRSPTIQIRTVETGRKNGYNLSVLRV